MIAWACFLRIAEHSDEILNASAFGKQNFFLDKQTAYCLFIVISFDDL